MYVASAGRLNNNVFAIPCVGRSVDKQMFYGFVKWIVAMYLVFTLVFCLRCFEMLVAMRHIHAAEHAVMNVIS